MDHAHSGKPRLTPDVPTTIAALVGLLIAATATALVVAGVVWLLGGSSLGIGPN